MKIKKEKLKSKIYFICLIIFTVLNFVGAFYVLANRGEVNAGYAVIPMSFVTIFNALLLQEKKKNKE